MVADLVLKALIAMAPVLLLLVVFDRLDVFNLIPMREIGLLVLAGCALALIGLLANWRMLEGFPIGRGAFTRYVAPIVEETMKAAPIVFLFARNRLGFKLDAAIAGFAIGAGFSVAENAWFLFTLTGTNISDWLVRGLGTAIMHGATTALFAIISHEMSEKQSEGLAAQYRFKPLLFLPGLVVAMAVHSLFNHFPDQPLAIMVLTFVLAPLTLFLALAKSETATRQWLAADAAAHRQLLEDIRAGRFGESDIAGALQASGGMSNIPAAEVLAYVQLKLELVFRAEELILASHDGAGADGGDVEREKFAQLDAIEGKFGRAFVAALESRVGFTRNDLYELGRLRARLAANEISR